LDRDIGEVEIRLSGMERIDLFAGGGADLVRIGGMTGSGVQEVHIDLDGVQGAGTGDRVTDMVVLSEGEDASFVTLLGDGGSASVLGLDAFVGLGSVDVGDRAMDRLAGVAPRGAGRTERRDAGDVQRHVDG
jgi:hypothetical protein